MERKRKPPAGKTRTAGKTAARKGIAGRLKPGELPPDQLSSLARDGNEEAFLALVRFHSTFNPVPLTPELLLKSRLEEKARDRLLARLKRKEDALLKPFPAVDLVFWGETWVQKTLDGFMWRKRGGKAVPNEAFLKRLWDASSEGAMLQLRIYKKVSVTPSAWVRVKYPHFANIGLSDAQMLKIARAEGCRFGAKEFLAAVLRFREGPPGRIARGITPARRSRTPRRTAPKR